MTTPNPTTQPRSRRALLAGMLGGLGAWTAAAAAKLSPVDAVAGDPLIIGSTANSAGTSSTSLTSASSGTALLVTQNGSGTALRGSAVGAGSIAGFFTANNGTGISGVTGNPASYGVYGGNDGAAGSGAAMRASGQNNHGLVATTANGNQVAVGAFNTGPAGTGAALRADGGNNDGVLATTTGTTRYGVRGTAPLAGVFGEATNTSSDAVGVYGLTTNGYGVYGDTVNGTGVLGTSPTTGVQGSSDAGVGVRGVSNTGYAGYFQGGLFTTQFVELQEIPDPAAPSSNLARLFVRDSGGKSQLCVLFASGAVQVVAMEP